MFDDGINTNEETGDHTLQAPLLPNIAADLTYLVVFKIDFCLLAYGDLIRTYPRAKKFLTRLSLPKYKNQHYGINVRQMANIFRSLLDRCTSDPSISIAFITQYKYDSSEIKAALEQAYNLPENSFNNVAFLRYGDFTDVKDDISLIKVAQQSGIVPKHRTAILVTDNQPLSELEAEVLNIDIIRSLIIQNPHYPGFDTSDRYLDVIIEKLNLPYTITAQVFTPMNDMHREEQVRQNELIRDDELKKSRLQQTVDCLVFCLCCKALSNLMS